MTTEDGLLHFACPHCQESLAVPKELAGVEGPCPICEQHIKAPELELEEPDQSDPTNPTYPTYPTYPTEQSDPTDQTAPPEEPEQWQEPPAPIPAEDLYPDLREVRKRPFFLRPGFLRARTMLALVSVVVLALVTRELMQRGVFKRDVPLPEKPKRGLEPQIGPGSPSTVPGDREKRLQEDIHSKKLLD